jgi:hypothetical protein
MDGPSISFTRKNARGHALIKNLDEIQDKTTRYLWTLADMLVCFFENRTNVPTVPSVHYQYQTIICDDPLWASPFVNMPNIAYDMRRLFAHTDWLQYRLTLMPHNKVFVCVENLDLKPRVHACQASCMALMQSLRMTQNRLDWDLRGLIARELWATRMLDTWDPSLPQGGDGGGERLSKRPAK